ncbi:adhesion G protein-coupled receptor E2-like isoform X2 [Oncorhynchus nerka]|uniref:adhesion G protein-coupled receptor E2-like isoform X2 n=1 Tax=Oncorhynchus nerka TaxID=8023 RepID=UPI0031B8534D
MGSRTLLLVLGLHFTLLGNLEAIDCDPGFTAKGRQCDDIDECKEWDSTPPCGSNATCYNTHGSFYCQCLPGFKSTTTVNFTALTGECNDLNECQKTPQVCGSNASCLNTIGSYKCQCQPGFRSTTPVNYTALIGECKDMDECKKQTADCPNNLPCVNTPGSYACICQSGYKLTESRCEDIDECNVTAGICGEGGTCQNQEGSYSCLCLPGYSNYGNKQARCSVLTCDQFKGDETPGQNVPGLAGLLSLMRNSCLALSNSGEAAGGRLTGEMLLENVFTQIDSFLSQCILSNSREVSRLLGAVEDAMKLIAPQLRNNHTTMGTDRAEAEIAVRRGQTPPIGPISLANDNARLDTSWETATGNGTYPGFSLAGLVCYKTVERYVNDSFQYLTDTDTDTDTDTETDTDTDTDTDTATATASKPNFQISSKVVTAFVSNPATDQLTQPVILTFKHLQDTFELRLLTWLGLSVSVVCLLLCILTFWLCRSIQGTRTTIHLHLCVCLFIADLVFLSGISHTQSKGGCGFVAGLLHLFFLGSFSWMLLEGVQLYLMVVLVFNTTIRPLYLHAVGYGLPLTIVIISAITYPDGYGTTQHCWLSLERGFIWSFFGPVCTIIFLNAFIFIITVWRLAQKFSSLNPDLSNLHKIKVFTVTAVAQLCVLGTMWIFGVFQFQEEGTVVMTYLFTILNSLQGALLFIMHCLLNKTVREEYCKLLSCICTPQKKRLRFQH